VNIDIKAKLIEYLSHIDFLPETIIHWVLTVLAFVCFLPLTIFTRRMILKRAAKKRGQKEWPIYVEAIFGGQQFLLLFAVALYVSLELSPLHPDVKTVLRKIFGVALTLQVGLWVNTLVAVAFARMAERNMAVNAGRATIYKAAAIIARLILFAIIALVALDNLGFNVSGLVAGVGIGGIAVALGVQKILGDVFAAISIMIDQPFVLGDSLTVGDYKGTVENIGIKSTRLRSFSGETILFSNSDLLSSRLKNFSNMRERRLELNISVPHETPYAKLKNIPDTLKNIVSNTKNVRFERAFFKEIGASSYNFEYSYYILQADYDVYAETQQSINLKILENFQTMGIRVANLNQRIVVDSSGEKTIAP